MKKNLIMTVSALAVSSALAAGGINAAAQGVNDSNLQSIDAVNPQKTASLISESAQAPDAKTQQVSKIRVKAKKWDEEKLKELFISPEESFDLTVNNSDMFVGNKFYVYDGVKENGEEFWLVYETGRLTAEYRSNSKGQHSIATTLGVYDFGDFFGDKDLSLFTREDAKNMVSPVLAELGITNAGEPEVHAFSAENANKYLSTQTHYVSKQDDTGCAYPEWSAEDEIYVLRYPLMYNDLPLSTVSSSTGMLGNKWTPFAGSFIDVIVTKDGILSIESYQLFSSEYEEAEDVAINCDYESALEKGNEYFTDWTGEFNSMGYMGIYDYEIESCKLVYVPIFDDEDYAKYFSAGQCITYTEDVDFTLVPMWRVDATIIHSEDSFEGRRGVRSVFIDPQTGNVM